MNSELVRHNKVGVYPVSWQEIKLAARLLRDKVQYAKPHNYEKIYALGRGGLVPARLMSGLLGVKNVEMLQVPNKKRIKDNNYTALIVDDIFDTGKTYHQMLRTAPLCRYGFLFIRTPHCGCGYDYGVEIEHQKYLLFPYEHDTND